MKKNAPIDQLDDLAQVQKILFSSGVDSNSIQDFLGGLQEQLISPTPNFDLITIPLKKDHLKAWSQAFTIISEIINSYTDQSIYSQSDDDMNDNVNPSVSGYISEEYTSESDLNVSAKEKLQTLLNNNSNSPKQGFKDRVESFTKQNDLLVDVNGYESYTIFEEEEEQVENESYYSKSEYYEDDLDENIEEPTIQNKQITKPILKSPITSSIPKPLPENQNYIRSTKPQKMKNDDIPIGKFFMIDNSSNLASSAKIGRAHV